MSKAKRDKYFVIEGFYFWYSLIGIIIALPLILDMQLNISLFGISLESLSNFGAMVVFGYYLSFLFCQLVI